VKTSSITFISQSDQDHIKVGSLFKDFFKKKSSVGEDVEHPELSYTPGGSVYWYNHFETMEESTKAE